MKIKTLSLTDFRAFPGPAPAIFELDSNNLLVYGENGSGKSSLFHALQGFFAPSKPTELLKLRNSFSEASIGCVKVEVGFDDLSAAAWHIVNGTLLSPRDPSVQGPAAASVHPGHGARPNANVTEAAKFSAVLDYRSLLNTNYKHGDDSINLFNLAVSGFLASYVDLATNKTIGQLWADVLASKPVRNTVKTRAICVGACNAFNNGIKKALALLLVEAQAILQILSPHGLPVLNVLVNRFSDWQVILLTHDKGWFDLARQRLPSNVWNCCEIYEGDPAASAPMPIVRKTAKRPAPALLQKARDLLLQGYTEAAANYVRQAFETGIRAACELKNIKIAYKQDVTSHQAQDLLNGLKTWPGTLTVPKIDWDAALHQLELMKDVVMNPYSHPSAPNIPRQEVVNAADAVDAFLTLVRTK